MSTTRSSWSPYRATDEVAREPTLRVDLAVALPVDILARYYPNGKKGGLTVDGPMPSALGQLVELWVKVERPAREFQLSGQLAWARHKGSRNLKECYGVDFLGHDEASKRLLAFARQDLEPAATRASVRLATDLKVRITHLGQTRREFLADLSQGGAFVRSGMPAEIGEILELHLRPPGSLTSIVLSARVRWVRATGAEPGMGLEFLDTDAKVLDRLGKVLARLDRS
jgi:uncharacterized protein (TIGR02266 family)